VRQGRGRTEAGDTASVNACAGMGVRKLYGWVKGKYAYVVLRHARKTVRVRPPSAAGRPGTKPGSAGGEKVLKEVPTTREVPLRFSGMEIDGNALLHEAAQWAHGYGIFEGETQGIPDKLPDGKGNPDAQGIHNGGKRRDPTPELIAERFIFLVEEALTLIKPSTRLYLAIDGVAPLAKAQQQRTRRFLSAARAASAGTGEARADEDEGEVPSGGGAFDTSVISPGTPFMDKVDAVIRAWLRSSHDRLPKQTIYYSHRLAGEGEHKLLDALSSTVKARGGMKQKSGKTASGRGNDEYDVIYGNDNDLIILAMMRTRKTMILRDALDRKGDPELLRDPPELGRFALVDVPTLAARLESEYELTPADFSVCMLILGNDFVPTTPIGFPVYATIEVVLNLYYELKRRKPTSARGRGDPNYVLFDDHIHWDDLYYLLAALQRAPEGQQTTREQQLLLKRYEEEDRSNSAANRGFDGKPPRRIERTVALQTATKVLRGSLVVDADEFRDAYWRGIFPGLLESPWAAEVVIDVCDAYLEAFTWSTTYYALGVAHVNKEWYYRYHYAPTLAEVVEVLKAYKDVDRTRWERLPLDRSGAFLNPLELEVAILPLNALNEVLYGGNELSEELLAKVFTPLRDLFPMTVKIDGEGHDIPDKAVVRLPFADAARVRVVAATLDRPDVAAVEREPLRYPFDRLASGRTKTGKAIRTKKPKEEA
jgi:5'-3' exonuclease